MIRFDAQENAFYLDNGRITYCFGVVKEGYLESRYFGRHLRRCQGSARPAYFDRGFCSNPDSQDKRFSLDTLPQEYPGMNQGDFRSPAYAVETADGRRVTRFLYQGYEILPGKPSLPGLPATYVEQPQEAQTLVVRLADAHTGAQIQLFYTIFRDLDAICRHVEVVNGGREALWLERLMAMSLDLPGNNYDLLTLSGSHLMEKVVSRRPLTADSVVLDSCRGASSPQQTPCVVLTDPQTDETHGRVWAVNFVYSGDFQGVVQMGQYGGVRVQMGMNPLTFGWNLEPGQRFVSPECVLVYSQQGLNGMSHTFHRLYAQRLCRGPWRDRVRPILLNSWEAFTFSIDEEKCLSLAKQAAQLGMELFVLDDGWFKNRMDDRRALGDWVADPVKFPHGLGRLAQGVREAGVEFGIWFEPEMVSYDSDLYRNHPDWVIRSPYYDPVLSRSQLVLDLSNPAVQDYLVEAVSAVLTETGASYVKWDMNRHITDLGSAWLSAGRQRELSHRYMLGLYRVLEQLNQRFPQVLFEGCSSGGGRFDAGMLHYMPQTWTSDNTDAVCRLQIQFGTSLLFPPVTMGCHVSAVPNHQTGRVTSLQTRFAAALGGNLGYEMDIRTLTPEEQAEVKEQIRTYKALRETVQHGTFYRLLSPQRHNDSGWNLVSQDGNTVVCCQYRVLADPLRRTTVVHLQGLDPEATYRRQADGVCFGGDELMYAGLSDAPVRQDFVSVISIFQKVEG